MVRRPRSTHLGTARLGRLVATGVASLVMLSACKASVSIGAGSPEVSQSDVEAQVATQLAANVNQPKPTITCPGPLPAKVGASIDCDLVAQGDTVKYPVHVVVDSVTNGTAHFTAQVGQAPIGGGGDKTAFCADNAVLDMATSVAATPADLIPIFKAKQATISDFDSKAPADIKVDADAVAKAAQAAVASNDASAFATPTLQASGMKVDAYCAQNADGTPITAPTTTSTP
jgi:hypothetical protein